MMCPHGGTVNTITANARAKAAGDFILLASDTFIIADCPFMLPPGVPHPCLQVQWVQPDRQSRIEGDFTLSEGSVGFCVAGDMAVQGTVLITFTQPRVSGR